MVGRSYYYIAVIFCVNRKKIYVCIKAKATKIVILILKLFFWKFKFIHIMTYATLTPLHDLEIAKKNGGCGLLDFITE